METFFSNLGCVCICVSNYYSRKDVGRFSKAVYCCPGQSPDLDIRNLIVLL